MKRLVAGACSMNSSFKAFRGTSPRDQFKFIRVKIPFKSVNLCKFTGWCTDVLADKPHPRFDTKILSKKVRLIGRCLRYIHSKEVFLKFLQGRELQKPTFLKKSMSCLGEGEEEGGEVQAKCAL